VIVVGSMMSLVARSMTGISRSGFFVGRQFMSAARRLETIFVNSWHETWTKQAPLPTYDGQFSCCAKMSAIVIA
jgi:hypothetical protein